MIDGTMIIIILIAIGVTSLLIWSVHQLIEWITLLNW